MAIVSRDQDLLDDVAGEVHRIGDYLRGGVDLSDEAVARIAEAISRQAQSSREVRAIALRAMGPVADLLERQLRRLQVRAVELVREGKADQAQDELQEGIHLVAALLNEAPTDPTALLQLGFIYKTWAQVAADTDRPDEAAGAVDSAEQIFRQVQDDVTADGDSALRVANALHGQGNVEQLRGNLEEALSYYRRAVNVVPMHSYALHDIFSVYYELAQQGDVRLDEARQALDDLRATNPQHLPGFGAQYLTQLDQALTHMQSSAP